MLKKITHTQEFFYDIEKEVSQAGGTLKRGAYMRMSFLDGFAWFDAKGIEITEYRAGQLLEKKYKEYLEHLENEEAQRIDEMKQAFGC